MACSTPEPHGLNSPRTVTVLAVAVSVMTRSLLPFGRDSVTSVEAISCITRLEEEPPSSIVSLPPAEE